MTGFINRSKYATILTEDIPGNNHQMRFIADKHSFQLTGTNTDTYTLSNIVGYNENKTVLSMVDNWVGIGTTIPIKLFNKFDVYDSSSILTVNSTSVGIGTNQSTENMSLTVYGSAHITDNVGIGTFYPKERLQVYGNIMAFSFKASGGDYSEWELLEKGETIPEPGTVIGFNDQGKITSKWSKSKCFGIVSNKPSIIGNQDLYDAHPNETKIPVVYMGKIVLHLKDEGAAGDYIYVVQDTNDHIRLKIFPVLKQWNPNAIGYIRRKIKEQLYEVIVRI